MHVNASLHTDVRAQYTCTIFSSCNWYQQK